MEERLSSKLPHHTTNNIINNDSDDHIPSKAELRLLSILIHKADDLGLVVLSKVDREEIAEILNVTEKRVRDLLNSLRRKGFIKILYKGGGIWKILLLRGLPLVHPAGVLSPQPPLSTLSPTLTGTGQAIPQVYLPDIIHPYTLSNLLSIIFERVRVHSFNLYFELVEEYQKGELRDKVDLGRYIGKAISRAIINVQGKSFQISLPNMETPDILEGITYVLEYVDPNTIIDICRFIEHKYKLKVSKLKLVQVHIAFVYKDDYVKRHSIRESITISMGDTTIRRHMDRSTGKWELELEIVSDKAFNVAMALLFMNNKFLWDIIKDIDDKVTYIYNKASGIDEIKILLKQILEKLDSNEKKDNKK